MEPHREIGEPGRTDHVTDGRQQDQSVDLVGGSQVEHEVAPTPERAEGTTDETHQVTIVLLGDLVRGGDDSALVVFLEPLDEQTQAAWSCHRSNALLRAAWAILPHVARHSAAASRLIR